MAFGGIFHAFNTIRELNLGEIKANAEERFTLLVVGDAALAGRLADALSVAPGQSGRHPWIEILPANAPDLPARAKAERGVHRAAIAVTGTAELGEAGARAVKTLHDAGVPVVTAIMADGAETWRGADLKRPGESARALLPSSPDTAAVQTRLVPALLAAAPDDGLHLALARRLPVLRDPMMRALIEDVARTNAAYSFSTGIAEIAPLLTIPLNLADVLVLTKNQLVMAYKVALMAGKEGSVRDLMVDVAGVVGGGLLLRQIARELIGLIPVVGIIPKVAVAYAGTRLIGQAIYLWEVHGQRANVGDLRSLYDETLAAGRRMAEGLVQAARERGGSHLPPGPPSGAPSANGMIRR